MDRRTPEGPVLGSAEDAVAETAKNAPTLDG